MDGKAGKGGKYRYGGSDGGGWQPHGQSTAGVGEVGGDRPTAGSHGG